ncbi:hypothetical protein BCU68_11955 [Vibrio sp. 10N.286.49.B3]|uniref:NifB/NifX family molybdenum-iron cluster-binding protein n=1 Tax=Vibrio sp. 10N.286.49.B3 TaxID=1880855 RepID=UPI000CC8F5BA|nr:NifB/NifX family molybdenum-iron cluster-binding protein [Vibrio sp. 10N.286.49.B3]PMH44851.1 hypothetical protein BCU68_11955 [Vibrio sp. 10N.286.49.B3]
MLNNRRKLSVEPRPNNSEFSFNIAFATQDRHHVDQHFGTAKCVLIYGVGKKSWSLLEAIEYQEVDEDRHGKLPSRINDLSVLNCAAIYCNACGVSAIRQLMQSGVNPVKVQQGMDIHALIASLQKDLVGTPTGWIKRALMQKPQRNDTSLDDQQRLEHLMDEEWV